MHRQPATAPSSNKQSSKKNIEDPVWRFDLWIEKPCQCVLRMAESAQIMCERCEESEESSEGCVAWNMQELQLERWMAAHQAGGGPSAERAQA